jgi:hypothetical protein
VKLCGQGEQQMPIDLSDFFAKHCPQLSAEDRAIVQEAHLGIAKLVAENPHLQIPDLGELLIDVEVESILQASK